MLAADHRRGSEIFALDLLGALHDRDPGLAQDAVAVRRTGRADALPVPSLPGPPPRALSRLRRAVRTADVCVAHGSTALPACAAACAGSTPFVYRSVGDPTHWSGSGLRRRRTDLLLSRARAVVPLFEGARAALVERGLRPEQVHVIPNGVPLDRFPPASGTARAEARRALGIDPGARVVLALGALSEEKRPGWMVHLAEHHRDWTVVLAGDGPLLDEVRRSTSRLANLIILGGTDPVLALHAADVVGLPSRTEGHPAAAIEAGLVGLPVVATDVGGTADVVVHGRTGWLVDPEDPVAFDAAVGEALEDGTGRGDAARAWCEERFALDLVAERWAALLEEVVG